MATMDNFTSLSSFTAEIFLAGFIILLLAASFFRKNRESGMGFAYAAGIFGIVGTLLFELQGWTADNNAVYLFYGMLRNDSLAHLFKLLCLLSSLLLLVFSLVSRETNRRFDNTAEYVLLILSATFGMMLMASSENLLMMYLSLEFLSLTSYMLTGFTDRDAKTSEAAVKYLLYGGIASGVMLYGLSLLYGITGALDYASMREFFAGHEVSGIILHISIIMVMAGMGFKIASFPFHSWCPDVYEGAMTPFTAFLSVGSKAAGFAIIIRFFSQIFGLETTTKLGHTFDWQTTIAVLSACSMTFGNLAALQQKNIKRLLAYSSIAHAGYILMAVACRSQLGVTSAFFYLSVYFLMNFGAFLVVIIISNELNSDMVSDYEGLVWKNRKGAFLAAMFAIYLFSLTGVPPFAGFIGKFYLLLSVLEKGRALYWLAGVAVLNTVISFYYYSRILRLMLLSRRLKGADLSEMQRGDYLPYSLMAGLAILTILFGIYWTPLYNFSRLAGMAMK
ncbi:MAG: NADH-quinone oxidoreductase subunit N [Nitrospira bacterium HGW-Nitrospira-1]|nr:MAG: NADH-quinone oxidoreductase subunit N [Nitrospira bacterium HGW-Nitrospira-1]